MFYITHMWYKGAKYVLYHPHVCSIIQITVVLMPSCFSLTLVSFLRLVVNVAGFFKVNQTSPVGFIFLNFWYIFLYCDIKVLIFEKAPMPYLSWLRAELIYTEIPKWKCIVKVEGISTFCNICRWMYKFWKMSWLFCWYVLILGQHHFWRNQDLKNSWVKRS